MAKKKTKGEIKRSIHLEQLRLVHQSERHIASISKEPSFLGVDPSFLGVEPPFFSTIVLFKTRSPFPQGVWWFCRKIRLERMDVEGTPRIVVLFPLVLEGTYHGGHICAEPRLIHGSELFEGPALGFREARAVVSMLRGGGPSLASSKWSLSHPKT